MPKTYIERILGYLWSVGPRGASNAQIREETGIRSHQQVYLLTQELLHKRKIASRRDGHEWLFFIGGETNPPLTESSQKTPAPTKTRPAQFEDLARRVFGQYFNASLGVGRVEGVPKLFDLVSADGSIVGDAKYYTLVNGQDLPPAKFATIAEHVWLLEKTQARHKFLVFGNDIEVPKRWLSRYGHLRGDVMFYFLGDDGEISGLD